MKRCEMIGKYRRILLTGLCLIFLSGCAQKEENSPPSVKPVRTALLQEDTRDITIGYTGNVIVKDSRSYAFKSPGKIASLEVEKGDEIKPGDVLAKLDTRDLDFAVQAAQGQVEAADSQYQKAKNGATKEEIEQLRVNLNKAKDALAFTEDLYRKMEELYQSGAVARHELDKAKLEYDLRKSEMQQAELALQTALSGTRSEDIAMARANLSMARTELEYKKSQIADATIYADISGYVAEIIKKEGDFVAAGHPVIALRGQSSIVRTGIARQDLDKVHIGSRVYIIDGEKRLPALITYISDIADAYTRTYEAEITPEEGTLSIGSIVGLEIVIGNETGIWVPVSAMLAEGKDYVLTVEEDNEAKEIFKVKRKDIRILSTRGAYAKVEGLSPGDRLIVEGMRGVKADENVRITGEDL